MPSTLDSSRPTPNVFQLLAAIRARPGMFLGHDEDHVRERLTVLESLLRGYGLALEQLGYEDLNVNFLRELGTFIQPKLGYGNEIGPVFASLKHNPEQPLQQFWQFVDEFRAARGL